MSANDPRDDEPPQREPLFLLPGAISVILAGLWVVHAAAAFTLGSDGVGVLRLWFGFVPYRLTEPAAIPGGMLPAYWSVFTHAFLHADWTHLILNSVWLAIFGTPVARRYGSRAAIAVFVLGAAAGAIVMFLSLLLAANQFTVLIGASGGVAALTGAAMRFVFEPVVVGHDPETGERRPLGRHSASLAGVFANGRSRAFVLIWLGLNLAIPLVPLFTGAPPVPIAWQAHVGGFVAGLLLVSAFDRRAKRLVQR